MSCSVCKEKGHNKRTCKSLSTSARTAGDVQIKSRDEKRDFNNNKTNNNNNNQTIVISNVQPNYNLRKTEDELVPRRYKQITPKLNDAVMSLITIRGPTEKDGPGFIYMYGVEKSKDNNIFLRYKIGMSEKLPTRRIKRQSQANHENYTNLYTEGVGFRKLAEKAIHLQLADYRIKRLVKIGSTEWFEGDGEKFRDAIKEVRKVIMEVYPLANAPDIGLP